MLARCACIFVLFSPLMYRGSYPWYCHCHVDMQHARSAYSLLASHARILLDGAPLRLQGREQLHAHGGAADVGLPG